MVDFITLTVGKFWSHAKQPVNLQIEREIRPLAFCWFIIIFISLVTVSVVSELDTGFALFYFLSTWRNFLCLQYY